MLFRYSLESKIYKISIFKVIFMFFEILRQQIYEWSFYIHQNLLSSFREIVHCYEIELFKIVNSENNNTRALLVSIRQYTLFGHPSLLGCWCPISKFEEAKRFVRKTHCILLLWISKLTDYACTTAIFTAVCRTNKNYCFERTWPSRVVVNCARAKMKKIYYKIVAPR